MYRIFSMNVAHPLTQCGKKMNFLNFHQYLQFIFCIIPMRINISYANFHCVSESSWQILFLNKSCFSSCLSKQVFIIFLFLVVSAILNYSWWGKGSFCHTFPKGTLQVHPLDCERFSQLFLPSFCFPFLQLPEKRRSLPQVILLFIYIFIYLFIYLFIVLRKSFCIRLSLENHSSFIEDLVQ